MCNLVKTNRKETKLIKLTLYKTLSKNILKHQSELFDGGQMTLKVQFVNSKGCIGNPST